MLLEWKAKKKKNERLNEAGKKKKKKNGAEQNCRERNGISHHSTWFSKERQTLNVNFKPRQAACNRLFPSQSPFIIPGSRASSVLLVTKFSRSPSLRKPCPKVICDQTLIHLEYSKHIPKQLDTGKPKMPEEAAPTRAKSLSQTQNKQGSINMQ